MSKLFKKTWFARASVLILALASVCILTFSGRFLYLALVQEGRPALWFAALRVSAGAAAVTVDEEDGVYLATAAMERLDGDWPIRKYLESKGFTYVDQLGAMTMWRDPSGREQRFESRMFTRAMMVVERRK